MSKGFGITLTEQERRFMAAFGNNTVIACPTIGSPEEVLKVARSLRAKQLIKGVRPFELTKKGVEFNRSRNKESRQSK